MAKKKRKSSTRTKPAKARRKKPPRRRAPRPGWPRDGLVPGFSNDERLGLEAIFAGIVRSAALELRPATPPLDVVAWASQVWGIWSGKELIGQDSEEVFGGGLIDHSAASPSPAGVRVLRALSAVAPRPYAARAKAAADRLVAQGTTEAPWSPTLSEPVRPTGASILDDPVDDDGVCVLIGFSGALGDHTLAMYVDWNMGGMAKDAFLAPCTLDETVARMSAAASAAGDEGANIRRLSTAEAAARWREALWMTDHTLDPPVSDEFRTLRTLVNARLGALPANGNVSEPPAMSDSERDALLQEFMASESADRLLKTSIGPDLVEDIAFQCLIYALDYAGGAQLRFSPTMVELFCCDWAPRKVVGDARMFEAIPSVLRAWIAFCGLRRGIPAKRIDEAVSAVEVYEAELREVAMDPSSWGPAKAMIQAMQDHGIDLMDEHAVSGFIAKVNSGQIDVTLNTLCRQG